MPFGSRKPIPDYPVVNENPYGTQSDVDDDTAVLLSGRGKRCCICKRVILNRHLRCRDGDEKPYCPDCV